jgi:hypothetical protein
LSYLPWQFSRYGFSMYPLNVFGGDTYCGPYEVAERRGSERVIV